MKFVKPHTRTVVESIRGNRGAPLPKPGAATLRGYHKIHRAIELVLSFLLCMALSNIQIRQVNAYIVKSFLPLRFSTSPGAKPWHCARRFQLVYIYLRIFLKCQGYFHSLK